ncbi:ATP-dependent RNA helicase DeaD [Bathymodiolus platifrons methanotrophic gill symbiont]|uniref:DEAD/DEAH box helicase n=1 Tax=Bathymodiolus platifrons methanotrophic gill symbiont TaxID=113268 RepID=UPI000B408586|nr:DEAD/DEAH box helicase [Bathymodiolus platifrons methanotrophic gill symbiont]MCK5869195.1 DEAD/DEAH box helicase [Methyloprofundus sp.]TXK95964.1 ATP-dependent RNA helicase [Methylococcaceae bacterium CS5]TXK96064.1 ATP-dependent RNA helicase [Methylococcaceae bacterium CS4]TXL05661.1 ATP-dependent RNA helicase [Methylococcaceae bacterium CS1]TXL06197.1 ATP-dependent RNA helicase [Methylococcaceae bacterium CS3]TXL10323.1 ATP-dependent RNA helicase [Methylococcaceae bacterium CS2]TXL1985
MTFEVSSLPKFSDLDLIDPLFKALDEVGYETPSPIQAQTIPLILEGRDVLGQAQTGTGKTAAFALPLLSKLDLQQKDPQVLVLAPTRELAIQVAEAFQTYAKFIKGFHVAPIYGGQDYSGQLRMLRRGAHVVVGTPGRVMDHMRKGTLKLNNLTCLVLDEADEMLRMGFIDDVEWVLEQLPEQRQIALFSATMPTAIRRIANNYLRDPEHVTIKVKTTTAETIRQRYWTVSGVHKLDALTRILEAETFDGMIIFVRTKNSTIELAEKLEARGFSAAAINGDLAQNQREKTITKLKNGKLDILVATDVAARGLDVQRISHVINYDIPYDTEAYVHRIGRTGRAGRTGDAILFVAPREKRMLSAIERATKQRIELMEMPSTEMINDKRVNRFKQQITDTLANEELEFYTKIIEQYETEHDVPAIEVAAALAKLVQGDEPLLLKKQAKVKERSGRDRDRGRDRESGSVRRKGGSAIQGSMQRYRIEVGKDHGAKPGNIVGAIANEAGLNGKEIGQIDMHDDFSIVDLPKGMPDEVFQGLQATRVAGQKLNIAPVKEGEVPRQQKDSRRSGEKSDKKPRRKPRRSKSS